MIDAALETVFGAGVGGASAGAVVDVWGGLKFGLRVTCVRDRRRLPDKSIATRQMSLLKLFDAVSTVIAKER